MASALAGLEEMLIRRALDRCQGNRAEAAACSAFAASISIRVSSVTELCPLSGQTMSLSRTQTGMARGKIPL